MATRPKGYGLTAELASKIDSKYDEEIEMDVRRWMEQVVGEPLEGPAPMGGAAFCNVLKDGVYLCKLANTIMGAKIKINDSKMAFKQMENIGNFLQAMEAYGVHKADSFQTVDLYEAQNPPQVLNTLTALGRKAQAKGYDGPVLGPRESTENKREFTEEQLRAGAGIIGLQAGTNQGASQSGQNFGKTRAIID